MIEINLVEPKKVNKNPVILGMDLKQINVKLLVGAILFMYVPDITIMPIWESEKKSIEAKIVGLNDELAKQKKELEGSDKLRQELEAYNKQAENLVTRSNQIDQILKIRSNPKKLLEKLARSVPVDLWFNELKIANDKSIKISGGSTSWKSIGVFMQTINDSPFFGKSMILKNSTESSTSNATAKAERSETFSVEGKIETYEPF